MITKTYKNHVNLLIAGNGTSSRDAYIAAKNTSNKTIYLNGCLSGFPAAISSYLTTQNTGVGIMVGSGNTPATENDYKLESQITSGISGSVSTTYGKDENDNHYKIFNVIINNISTNDIVINEIGLVQSVSSVSVKGSANSGTNPVLIDRTVLSEPITISANDSKAIIYKFQASIYT